MNEEPVLFGTKPGGDAKFTANEVKRRLDAGERLMPHEYLDRNYQERFLKKIKNNPKGVSALIPVKSFSGQQNAIRLPSAVAGGIVVIEGDSMEKV